MNLVPLEVADPDGCCSYELGIVQTVWICSKKCLPFGVGKLYGDHDFLEERHRHRFEVKMLLELLSFSV